MLIDWNDFFNHNRLICRYQGNMMKKAEVILVQMDELLNLLIDNANKLLALSQQVIAEEELAPLQTSQQELLDELVAQDEAFHKTLPSPSHNYQSPLRSQINAKLDQFEQLNASFIENITSAHGLIQFEKGKLKKSLKKVSP